MMNETYAFGGAEANVKLSPIDQTIAALYSRRVLCFSLPSRQHKDAIETLRTAMQALVDQIPVLAMQVGPDPEAKQGGATHFIQGQKAYLTVKDLTSKLSYTELRARNFSSELLPPGDLCPVGPFQDPIKPTDLCHIQVNLIEDGLLLVFCIHHVVADGTAISTIIRTLASECRRMQGLSTDVKLDHSALDRSQLFEGVEGEADLSKIIGYTAHDSIPPIPVWAFPDARPKATTLFHISPSSIVELKAACSNVPASGSDIPTVPYITSHDAVTALLWSGIFCARRELGLFSDANQNSGSDNAGADDITATLAIPVNIRGHLSPPLPDDYIGNAVVHTSAQLSIAQLTGSDRLSLAARRIRASVRSLNDAYVRNFTSMCAGLKHTKHLELSCARDMWLSDFYTTSYRQFAPFELNWGPALGTFEAFRLPKGGIGNGCGCIFPVAKDGGWDFCLSIHEEVMAVFLQDELIKKYTTVVDNMEE